MEGLFGFFTLELASYDQLVLGELKTFKVGCFQAKK